jgi:hypothetical protein
VRTSVIVVENPRVFTTVGRKFLKPLGEDMCGQSMF